MFIFLSHFYEVGSCLASKSDQVFGDFSFVCVNFLISPMKNFFPPHYLQELQKVIPVDFDKSRVMKSPCLAYV